MTYNEIADKGDREHHNRAKRVLGQYRYMELVKIAQKAFEDVLASDMPEHRKPNKAKCEANLVFTRAMKERWN